MILMFVLQNTINSEVTKAKEVREMQEAGIKDLRSELNVLRSQSAQISLEKDELVERLKKLSETIKNQASILHTFVAIGSKTNPSSCFQPPH
jgi:hypothetical protein